MDKPFFVEIDGKRIRLPKHLARAEYERLETGWDNPKPIIDRAHQDTNDPAPSPAVVTRRRRGAKRR